MPSRLMCKVRGMGVAESVSTSTVVRRVLSHSLSSTPKRCSSSMITSPRSLNATSFWKDAVRADQDIDGAGGRALRVRP